MISQTMEEFRDFEAYVKGVDPFGMQSGIVLINPPEEWYVDLIATLYRTLTSAGNVLASHSTR